MSRGKRKIFQGEVVSNKMEKSIVVAIKSRKMHHLYKKYVGTTKRVMADDPKNEAMIGDLVRIVETRPLSRRKHWRLIRVIQKAS